MINYRVVDVAYAFENFSQFWQDHYEEVEKYTDVFPIIVDRQYYEALETAGILLIIAALDDESPVGYMVWKVISHHKHPVLLGVADLYYVHPEYRGKTVAYRMFQYAEECLKAKGVDRLIANCKVHHNNQKRLLMGLGFEHFEESYSKLLQVVD